MHEARSDVQRQVDRVELRPFDMEMFQARRAHIERVRRARVLVTGLALGALVVISTAFVLEARRHAVEPAKGPITPSNVSKLGMVWSFSTGIQSHSAPLVSAGGQTYVVVPGKLFAFSATCASAPTCSPIWSASLTPTSFGYWWGGATVDGERVYVGSGDRVWAFPTSCSGSCRPVWSGATGGSTISSAPTIADGVVYVGSDGAQRSSLYAFPTTCRTDPCTPLWFADLKGKFFGSTPVVSDGYVYVGTSTGFLEAFPVSCPHSVTVPCHTQWYVALDSGGLMLPVGTMVTPLRVSDGVLYAAAGARLYAYPIPCIGGACRPDWVGSTGDAFIDNFVVADGYVFATSTVFQSAHDNDTLTVFPTSCGTGGTACRPAWQMKGVSDGANVTVTDGLFYVGTSGAGISAFSSNCGLVGAVCRSLWSRSLPSPATSASAVSDGYVFVGLDSGDVLAFAPGGKAAIPLVGRLARPIRPSSWNYVFYVALFATVAFVIRTRRRRIDTTVY